MCTGSISVFRCTRSTRQPATISQITLSIPLEVRQIAFPEALCSMGLINYSLWTRLLNPTSYHSGTEVNTIVFCQVFHSTPVNKLMITATYIPLPSARSKWSVSLATGADPRHSLSGYAQRHWWWHKWAVFGYAEGPCWKVILTFLSYFSCSYLLKASSCYMYRQV